MPDYVGGSDISYNKNSDTVYAAIVVLRYPEMIEVERKVIISKASFPYVPGLLSFRELPPLSEAWDQLEIKPNVLIMDGQGIAHPRRFGLASHFGVIKGVSTIGCAKSLLIGRYGEIAPDKGAFSPLIDQEQQIGYVLRTRHKVNPVFVSPGNLITLKESARFVLECTKKYRVPEPTRLAHLAVNEARRKDEEAKKEQ